MTFSANMSILLKLSRSALCDYTRTAPIDYLFTYFEIKARPSEFSIRIRKAQDLIHDDNGLPKGNQQNTTNLIEDTSVGHLPINKSN